MPHSIKTKSQSVSPILLALFYTLFVSLFVLHYQIHMWRYAYLGAENLSLTTTTIVYISIAFFLFIFVVRDSAPATVIGLFLRIYFTLVIAPFSILVESYLKNDFFLQIEAYIVVLTPLLIARSIEYLPILKVKRINLKLCAGITGCWIISFFGLGLVVYLFLSHPDIGDFSLKSEEVYAKRIETRGIFLPGTPISYAWMIYASGLAPFLIFRGTLYTNFLFLFVGFLLSIFMFYFSGLKSPFALGCFALGIALLMKTKTTNYFFLLFSTLLFFLFLISTLELSLNQFSSIYDLILRRVLVMPSYVILKYFQYLDASQLEFFFHSQQSGINELVGNFIGIEGLNPNTNGFVYAYSEHGVSGLLAELAKFSIVLWILNSFVSEKYPDMTFVHYLFSFMILEFNVISILFSGGLVLIVTLIYFSKKQ